MSKKKTHEEYIDEVKKYNPFVEVIGIYINGKTKILHRCRKCGNEWYAIPTNVLKGCGCKSCAMKIARQKNGTRKMLRKSHAQYVNELSIKNPNIELMDEYMTTDNKNKFRCKICGYEWLGKPGSYIRGKGCYMCGKRKMAITNTRTTAQFILELSTINPDIEVLGEYITNGERILVRCKKCGRKWCPFASGLLSGHGCECNKIKLTRDILEEKKNDDISILRQIDNKNYECLCKKCNYKWISVNYCISRGNGCPNCFSSKGENCIKKYLESNHIKYKREYSFNSLKGIRGNVLRYDFYLPSYDLLIEFQGLQHFTSVEYFGGAKRFIIQQIHDIRKRKYVKEHKINFLTILYNEKNKIPQILDQYLNNLKLESVTTVIPSIAI